MDWRGAGYIHVAERETMQMREGEIVVVGGGEGVERSVHTMYMAYTQSCAEHMRHRSRGGEGGDKAFGDGCWMGYRGGQGEASTSTGGREFPPGRGEGRVNGIRQHAKSKSGVQPPLQKYESL